MSQYFIFFFLYWIVAKQKRAEKGEDLIRMRKVSLFLLSQLGQHFTHVRYSVLKRQWSSLWFFFIRNYPERGSMWGTINSIVGMCIYTQAHTQTHTEIRPLDYFWTGFIQVSFQYLSISMRCNVQTRSLFQAQMWQDLSQCHHISTPISILYTFVTKATIAGTSSTNCALTAACLFPSLGVGWTSSYCTC